MITRFLKKTTARASDLSSLTLFVNGQEVKIDVRFNVKARRYILRLKPGSQVPVLTVPRYGTLEEGKAFLKKQSDWLKRKLLQQPKTKAFEPGIEIPVRGDAHILQASGRVRGSVEVIDDGDCTFLKVSGEGNGFERRVERWLKRQASEDLHEACAYHANNLGLHYRSIALRDQKTRWGSCSSEGRLNFSWRLIFAPPEILDYVAAHEVAHLEEMNHSPAFWKLVRKTCSHTDSSRAWLKVHGASLHLYGR